MATQGTAADSCMGTEFHLGVLLVHSIGTQPPLDTLVRWTDALIEVINLAKPDSVGASVRHASPGPNSDDRPAEVELDLGTSQGAEPERWLVAEAWWGAAFPAPTYRELVSWTLRAFPGPSPAT